MFYKHKLIGADCERPTENGASLKENKKYVYVCFVFSLLPLKRRTSVNISVQVSPQIPKWIYIRT